MQKPGKSIRGGRIGVGQEQAEANEVLFERAVGATETQPEPGTQLRLQSAPEVVWRWQVRRRRR
ncbi:MAG: hypothetical protein AB4911_14420 [Oscillochloridaceae bacterium umkhey_bin13]